MSNVDKYGSMLYFLVGAESAIADDSPGARVVTPVGVTALSASQAKFGSNSIGNEAASATENTNYTRIAPNDASEFIIADGDDWTFEGWFYPTSIEIDMGIFSTESGSAAAGFGLYYDTTTTLRLYASETGSGSSNESWSTSGMTIGQWNHIVLQRRYSTPTLVYFDLWINGVWKGQNSATTNFNGTMNANNENFAIGKPWFTTGDKDFRGYYEDVRFTVGIARYTEGADISVPTSPYSPSGIEGVATIRSNRNELVWTPDNTNSAANIENAMKANAAVWTGSSLFVGGSDYDDPTIGRLIKSADETGPPDSFSDISANLGNTNPIASMDAIEFDSNFWSDVYFDFKMDDATDTGPDSLAVTDAGADLDVAYSRYGGAGDKGMQILDSIATDQSLGVPSKRLGDEFTIEFDLKMLTDNPTTAAAIFACGDKSSTFSTPYQWYLLYTGGSVKDVGLAIRDAVGNPALFVNVDNGSCAVSEGWKHICFMRYYDGSNYITMCFVDGVPQIDNDSVSSPDIAGYTGQITAVGYELNSGTFMDAQIDNFRITDIAKYRPAGFTPPTGPLPDGAVQAKRLMVGGDNAMFLTSTDEALSFLSKDLPFISGTAKVTAIASSYANQIACAVTDAGDAYFSEDYGYSWVNVEAPGGECTGVAIDEASGRIATMTEVATVVNVKYTTDGSSWQTSTGLSESSGVSGKIACNGAGVWCAAIKGNTIYVSTDNAASFSSALTTDAGDVFTDIQYDGGDGIDNPGVGFIACGYDSSLLPFVYTSLDGSTWGKQVITGAVAGASAYAIASNPEQ